MTGVGTPCHPSHTYHTCHTCHAFRPLLFPGCASTLRQPGLDNSAALCPPPPRSNCSPRAVPNCTKPLNPVLGLVLYCRAWLPPTTCTAFLTHWSKEGGLTRGGGRERPQGKEKESCLKFRTGGGGKEGRDAQAGSGDRGCFGSGGGGISCCGGDGIFLTLLPLPCGSPPRCCCCPPPPSCRVLLISNTGPSTSGAYVCTSVGVCGSQIVFKVTGNHSAAQLNECGQILGPRKLLGCVNGCVSVL